MNNNCIYIGESLNSFSGRYVVSYRDNGIYKRMPRANWVWFSTKGELVPKGFVIHHIDKDKTNDVIENLICVSRGEHNKLHEDDVNHYMFKKGHTYWSHPKSDKHKASIKTAHINRAKAEADVIYKKCTDIILNNPYITCNDIIILLGRKSHKVFRRLLNTTFRELKDKILNANTIDGGN